MRSYMSLSLSWPVVSGCTGGSVTAARVRRGLGRVVVIRVPFYPERPLRLRPKAHTSASVIPITANDTTVVTVPSA